ncbi:maleylpyruvate isomerase family mycothiol-dependent enzyme [Actinosynnema sp. NPDC020468]|uniref:maleylpyruvate isomerase family mycothiol-dependent enzyme n=1 Tax=Actinosynnema sp. NPDC020468 TaxID=3154488 RepID=UPI003402AEF8
MDYADTLRRLEIEYDALLDTLVALPPGAPVPTCPKWTVHDLVDHVAGVHDWVARSLRTPPDGDRPAWGDRPERWTDLVPHARAAFATMLDLFATTDPATPTWTHVNPKTYARAARRQLHEAAIHRLDAEHAKSPDARPTHRFDPDLAADGVDEYLTDMLGYVSARKPITTTGRILFHATDAGRGWEVALTEGERPVTGPPATSPGTTGPDTTVSGTADELFRAVWDRPNHASVTGDRHLLDSLPRP